MYIYIYIYICIHFIYIYIRANKGYICIHIYLKIYQQAVDQGHIDAHLTLGMCYLEGNGVEKDTEYAVKLLHIPANKGSSIAQFNLGCLYTRGQGVRKDHRQVPLLCSKSILVL